MYSNVYRFQRCPMLLQREPKRPNEVVIFTKMLKVPNINSLTVACHLSLRWPGTLTWPGLPTPTSLCLRSGTPAGWSYPIHSYGADPALLVGLLLSHKLSVGLRIVHGPSDAGQHGLLLHWGL